MTTSSNFVQIVFMVLMVTFACLVIASGDERQQPQQQQRQMSSNVQSPGSLDSDELSSSQRAGLLLGLDPEQFLELEELVQNQPEKRGCVRRGANCDTRPNECCFSSACRCNLWGTNCKCARMGLLQKWGR